MTSDPGMEDILNQVLAFCLSCNDANYNTVLELWDVLKK